MAFKQQKFLNAIKIVLEVLYVLAIIACIFLIIVYGFGLISKGNDAAQHNFTTTIIYAVIGLLISMLALVGIIKENKWIIIVLLIIQIIFIIINLGFATDVEAALIDIVFAAITMVFLYLIIQKQKDDDMTPVPEL